MLVVRYVGARVGSWAYKVGYRQYLFGQNRTHKMQVMSQEDYEALRVDYPLDFVVMPERLINSTVNLEQPISHSSGVISDQDKETLIAAGVLTIGQVLNVDAVTMGIDPDAKRRVAERVGFPVSLPPVEETPVEETPVEEAPVEETPVEEAPVEEAPAQKKRSRKKIQE